MIWFVYLIMFLYVSFYGWKVDRQAKCRADRIWLLSVFFQSRIIPRMLTLYGLSDDFGCFHLSPLFPTFFLQVYTPSGRIGSRRVTSGPLVEAIAGWDVTSCEATQPSDRRQILNYLVNPTGEKNGLLKDEYGQLILEQGWKKLLEDNSKDSTQKRRSGEAEYRHEAELFRDHAEAFSRLNRMVRDKVKEAVSVMEISKTGCRIHPIEQRGVLFGNVREFLKKVKLEICAHFDYHTVTTREVVAQILQPRYKQISYSEIANEGPIFPTYVIEHLWDGRLGRLTLWFAGFWWRIL